MGELSTQSELTEIQLTCEQLRNTDSPDLIAELKTELAGKKMWLGQEKVKAELAYSRKVNQVMRDNDWPAAKAKVEAEASVEYAFYLGVKQLYDDLKTVISGANSQLKVLEDERWQR